MSVGKCSQQVYFQAMVTVLLCMCFLLLALYLQDGCNVSDDWRTREQARQRVDRTTWC